MEGKDEQPKEPVVRRRRRRNSGTGSAVGRCIAELEQLSETERLAALRAIIGYAFDPNQATPFMQTHFQPMFDKGQAS